MWNVFKTYNLVCGLKIENLSDLFSAVLCPWSRLDGCEVLESWKGFKGQPVVRIPVPVVCESFLVFPFTEFRSSLKVKCFLFVVGAAGRSSSGLFRHEALCGPDARVWADAAADRCTVGVWFPRLRVWPESVHRQSGNIPSFSLSNLLTTKMTSNWSCFCFSSYSTSLFI